MRRLLNVVYAPLAALVLVAWAPCACLAVILGPSLPIRRETGRLCVRLLLLMLGVPLRVRGSENLPPGAAVLVCNHASYLDGVILTAALPRRFSFVVQDGAERWPLVGACLRRMGVVFINREQARSGARTTRELMRHLHKGEPLAVFAEGTFKAEPGLLPFKAGAFLMAARSHCPVVPAAIRGTRQLYGGGHWLPRHSRVEIDIAAPLRADGSDREAALALGAQARAIIVGLCGEPDRGSALRSAETARRDNPPSAPTAAEHPQ